MEETEKIENSKMKLFCNWCGTKHIDKGQFGKDPHRWHLCMNCGKKFWVPKPSIGI